jgi:hypothetical protein
VPGNAVTNVIQLMSQSIATCKSLTGAFEAMLGDVVDMMKRVCEAKRNAPWYSHFQCWEMTYDALLALPVRLLYNSLHSQNLKLARGTQLNTDISCTAIMLPINPWKQWSIA